jgi:uncharacterized protein YkwD
VFQPRRARRVVVRAALVSALVLPAPAMVGAHPARHDRGVLAAVGCASVGASPAQVRRAVARAALRCALNRARAQYGLRPLRGERHLRRAARGHVRDMVLRGYFGHQRVGGPSLATRLATVRWPGRAAGEALAWGCGPTASATATVAAWLASPPHRAIVLSAGYDRAGIGVARRAPGICALGGGTWVLDAGRR